jgi:hypothetical protein
MRHASLVPSLAFAVFGMIGCGSTDATTPSGSIVLGSTTSWFEGDDVTLDYTRQFACAMPPSAASPSGCEMGADAQTQPVFGTQIPVLYVMVPLGFTPDPSTLHCPNAGNCVAHPPTVDMTRVFGAGTASSPLPAHSHIIIDMDNHNNDPWKVEVIGVKDPSAWDLIAGTKNLSQVRLLQFQDPTETRITADISTNIFLFFRVR